MTRDCWGIARSKAQPDISGSKSTTRWRLRSKSTFSAPETLGAERRAVGALFFDIHAGAKRRGRAAKRFIPFSVRSETANRQPPVGRFFFAERQCSPAASLGCSRSEIGAAPLTAREARGGVNGFSAVAKSASF